MAKRFAFLLLASVLALLAACNRAARTDDKEAIRAALEKYLSERGNLNRAGMDMAVKQVSNTDASHAEAQVEFRAKQGGAAMQMTYSLERQGEAWVVKSGKPSGAGLGGGMPHPPVAPSAPASGMGTGELPPGHPPVTQPGKAPPAKKP